MTAPSLVIATRNRGKLREFAALLADLGIELLDLTAFPNAPEVREGVESYLANATAKAAAVARIIHLAALADDSGLEVDALDGQPGIRSARFAGLQQSATDNVHLLLRHMRGVPRERRTAHFRCSIVVARPDGRILSADGSCEGIITEAPAGGGGFGYDPVFFYPPAGRTFAEMRREDKDRVSHRANAVACLRPALPEFLRGPGRLAGRGRGGV